MILSLSRYSEFTSHDSEFVSRFRVCLAILSLSHDSECLAILSLSRDSEFVS